MTVITRRQMVLGSLGAAAGLASISRVGAERRQRVGVVGCGIVGAVIAYHLARAGARVVLFESRGPAQGATQNSFAWLNAFVDDTQYRDLRLASLAAYHFLDRVLRLGIIWGGYLNWADDAAGTRDVQATANQLAGTEFAVQVIDAERLAAISPFLSPGQITSALYSPLDGHLNPVSVTQRFVDAAAAFGCSFACPVAVRSVDVRAGKVTGLTTSAGRYPLDHVVVAGGVDSGALLQPLGYDLPLRHAPGVLAHSAPTPSLTRIIHDAPHGTGFKQMADGHWVAYDSPEPPLLPAHEAILHQRVDFPDETLRRAHGERILRKVAQVLPLAGTAGLARVTLGFRPMPVDDFPVLGAVPGVSGAYVSVTHSGVTLAPIIGQSVADEILNGTRLGVLKPYRPERFAARTTG